MKIGLSDRTRDVLGALLRRDSMIGVHEMVHLRAMYPNPENQPIGADLGPHDWGGRG